MVALCKPGGVSIYKVLKIKNQISMPIYKVSLYACFGVSFAFVNNACNKLTINVCDVKYN